MQHVLRKIRKEPVISPPKFIEEVSMSYFLFFQHIGWQLNIFSVIFYLCTTKHQLYQKIPQKFSAFPVFEANQHQPRKIREITQDSQELLFKD